MKGETIAKAEEVRGKAAPAAEVEVRHYAALLRQAIRAAGLSVAEVEQRLGLGPKSLHRVLDGDVDLTFKHALMVLRAIGMSQEEFFTIALRREGQDRRPEVSLEGLRDEFDALVQRMQTSEAKAAGRALFSTSPRRLGQAALAASRRP